MNSNFWEKKDHFSSRGLKICPFSFFFMLLPNYRKYWIDANKIKHRSLFMVHMISSISVFYDFSEVICGSVRFSSKQSRWHILGAAIFRIHFPAAQKGAAPTELWKGKGLSTNKFLQKIVSEEYILSVSIFQRFRLD